LFLSPEFAVDQVRENLSLRSLVSERFAWGRLFAYTRAREASAAKRLALTLLAPWLPALLILRHLKLQAEKKHLGQFLKASPAVLLLLAAWSLGEAAGYATAEP
jgi:hypothetical protein